jgi:hypothetical protein
MRSACITIAFFAFSLLFQVSGQNSPDYLRAIGDSQFDLGNYAGALSSWSKIPNPDAETFYKMSKACDRIGEKENAKIWMQRSTKLDPSIYRTMKNSFFGEDQIDNGGTEISNKGDHLYPITWNFETGNCQGWIKKGRAFQNQPVYGENNESKPGDQSLNHQGKYLIATSENCSGLSRVTVGIQGDELTGELISLPFIIQGDSISFLLGGGKSCSVNLIVNDEIALSATGNDTETMKRVEWNVSALKRKTAQIIVVDNSSEEWGHISFDDVRFDVHPSVIERANVVI